MASGTFTRGCHAFPISAVAGVEVLLYKRKYCPLHEAVRLIADRLAASAGQNCTNPLAAINEARTQLLSALFEGKVGAEGVRVYPTEPPAYEPPSIEYDEWSPIGRGVWLHERYEQGEDVYRLSAISVHWNEDYIDYFNSDGEWAEYMNTKIRLFRDDVDREFPVPEIAMEDSSPPSEPIAAIYKTGVAGRPTSKHLVNREMQRRAINGELSPSLAAEARLLRHWLQQCHPDAPPLGQKAAENAIRDEYRALKVSYPPAS